MQDWLNTISSLDAKGWEVVLLLLFGFALGLVFSSAFGLGPALIIRYLIVRGPMPKGKASLIYIPITFVSMLSFKAINQSPSATIIPWVIFYFIGRWILARPERKKQKNLTPTDRQNQIKPIPDSNSIASDKVKKIPLQLPAFRPHLSAMIGLLFLLGFMYFVWPTPYKDMGFPNPARAVRQNRFSGDIEQWDYETGSWQKVKDRALRQKSHRISPEAHEEFPGLGNIMIEEAQEMRVKQK
jgi:hypothetical protein